MPSLSWTPTATSSLQGSPSHANPERTAGPEATGADIEAPGCRARAPSPGHHRRGSGIVTIPLAPRTARVIDPCCRLRMLT
jgi:hypothetical protein